MALVIRAEQDQKSSKVGHLLVGSVVYVIQRRDHEGITRANIALRDNAKPRGWVTASRDGEVFLEIEGGLATSSKNLGDEGSAEKAAANKRSKASVDTDATHYTVASLEALAATQIQAAEAIDEQERIAASSLAAQLGDALRSKNDVSVKDYLRDWDLDGGGISKMEFRRSVRGLIPNLGTSSSIEIDALFDSIDTNHEGSLDGSELRKAFTKLKDDAKGRAEGGTKAKARAERLRRHADVSTRASAATAAAESAEKELAQAREKPRVEVRLGTLLAKRNIKVGDVVATWDSDGDGSLVCKEFMWKVREMGLDATDEELETLFEKIDLDGSGDADIPEIIAFLKSLQASRASAQEDEKMLAKRAAELRKAARQAQMEAHRNAQADEEERNREADHELQLANLKAAAEEDAKARAAMASKAKKERAEAAKQAFQAKIEQKRKAKEAKEAKAEMMHGDAADC